jgi:ubiquinone/menaquinone biosynthesis C-methylase UbiE
MPREPHEYVLGTEDAELMRLGFQHKVWSASAFALWERAGIGPGQRILDVGCGPGFATLDLLRLAQPGAEVLGVDVSERFLQHLEAQARALGLTGIRTLRSDVQTMRLAERDFDMAYARWVLCFVPDPEVVVRTVAHALRRGGRFAIQDYHHYSALWLAPRSAAMERVVQAVGESWRAQGGDPDVGTRLPGMLERHGMKVTELRALVRVARPGTMLWNWPRTFFSLFVPKLVENGFLSAAEQREWLADWDEHERTPGAFFQTPPMVEIIAERQ